jgi:nucleoid-associated protein YgaU
MARAPGLAMAAGLLAFGGVAAAAPAGTSHPHPAVSVDWPAAAPAAAPGVVRVEPGDCLWTIAARRLPHATANRVAVVWPRWWRTNRRVIGADPDLVRPGQRLRPPALTRSHS